MAGSRGGAPASLADEWLQFIENPARLVFIGLAFFQGILNGILDLVFPQAANPSGGRSGSFYWRNFFLEFILITGPFCDRDDFLVMTDSALLRWGGLLVYASGMIIAFLAAYQYRRSARQVNASPERPVLVTSGLFYSIRYPNYLGGLVYTLGIALLFRSLVGLFCLFMLIVFTILATQREDLEGARLHRGPWALYSRQSWRLIPYVF